MTVSVDLTPTEPTAPLKNPSHQNEVTTGSGRTDSVSQPEPHQTIPSHEIGNYRLEDIHIKKELRTTYEDLLRTTAQRIKSYQQTTGNELSDTQKEFLKLYDAKGGAILDTGQGWMLAHTMIESERFLLSAMVGKEFVGVIKKNAKHSPDENTITVQTEQLDQGWLNKHKDTLILISGTLATGGALLPALGIAKAVDSLLKADVIKSKVTLHLSDITVDTTALPDWSKKYIEYLSKGGQNRAIEYLKNAQTAKNEFYKALGATAEELTVTSPWQRLRVSTQRPRTRSIPVNQTQLGEGVDGKWEEIRRKKWQEIIGIGSVRLPNGSSIRLDLTNQEHVNAIFFEAQQQTIRHFLSAELPAIAEHTGERSNALDSMKKRITELSDTSAAQIEKQKEIEKIKKEIEVIEGNTSDQTLASGTLQQAKEKLQTLEQEYNRQEIKKLAEETQEDYLRAKREETQVQKEIAQIGKERDKLKKSIPVLEANFGKQIQKITDTQEYKTGYTLFANYLHALDQLESIERTKQSETRKLQAKQPQKAKEADEKRYENEKKNAELQIQIATHVIKEKSAEFAAFQSRQETVRNLRAQRENEKQVTQDKIDNLSEKLEVAKKELNNKQREREIKKQDRDRAKGKNAKFHLEQGKWRKQVRLLEKELEKKKKELSDVEEKDAESLRPKIAGKKRRLELIVTILEKRYDEICSDIQFNAGEKNLTVQDLSSTDQVAEGRRTYEKGYLTILNHLMPFQSLSLNERKVALRTAVSILPPNELARILHDTLHLRVQRGFEEDIHAVYTAIQSKKINQIEFARVFIPLLQHIQEKGLEI